MTDKDERTIHRRIYDVMKSVRYIQKAQPSDKGMKYSYVKHDDVTALLHDIFVEEGILAIPKVSQSLIQQFEARKIDYKTKKEVPVTVYRAEATIDVSFINVDDPKDFVVSEGWKGMGLDSQDKAIGKAYSYAYKYCLLKTFMLETGDEVDADQSTEYRKEEGYDAEWYQNGWDMYFEQVKARLMAANSYEDLKDIWVAETKHIAGLKPKQLSELETIKEEKKLLFEPAPKTDQQRVETGDY